MGLTENAAYIKGLAEGLGVNDSTQEGKIISKLIELVSDMAERISILEEENDAIYGYLEEMATDIIEIENDIYDDEEPYEYDDYSDLNDDDEYDYDEELDDFYQIECPSCGEIVCFSEEIDLESLACPACGEPITDIDICDDSMCEGCDGCTEKCDVECDGCTKA